MHGVVKISVGGVDVAGSTLDDVTHMIKSGTRPFEISFLVPDASDIEDTPKGGGLQLRSSHFLPLLAITPLRSTRFS